MVIKKTKQKRERKPCCLTPLCALERGVEYLQSLSQLKRNLLSKFRPKIEAYAYGKIYIWVVSSCPSANNPDCHMVLYVEVRNCVVHDELININELTPLKSGCKITIGRFGAWFDGRDFSVIKNGILMTLQQSDNVWQREKDKHLPRLKNRNFTVYEHPHPVFNKEMPIYVLAFHHEPFTQNVEALVIFPNIGHISTHVYSKYSWRKMIKKVGSNVIMGNLKITIGENGFETESI